MGMIVKERGQKLSRKGILVVSATSWRASAATALYWRILSAVSKDLGSIAKVWRIHETCEFYIRPTSFRCAADARAVKVIATAVKVQHRECNIADDG
jgi:hypothetical protein